MMNQTTCLLVCGFGLGMALEAVAQDVPVADSLLTGTYNAGAFTVEFHEPGEYLARRDTLVLVRGLYAISGDTLSLIDKSGVGACTAEGTVEGRYFWKQDGETLTFQMVDDLCPGRKSAMTSETWKKEP